MARAGEVLGHLEEANRKESIGKDLAGVAQDRGGVQLSFFQLDDPVLTQIRDGIATMTLHDLRTIITGKP